MAACRATYRRRGVHWRLWDGVDQSGRLWGTISLDSWSVVLLLSANKRERTETLTRCTQWFQFVVDYFISIISLTLLEVLGHKSFLSRHSKHGAADRAMTFNSRAWIFCYIGMTRAASEFSRGLVTTCLRHRCGLFSLETVKSIVINFHTFVSAQ